MSELKLQLHKLTAEYIQDNDCNDPEQDGYQSLTITAEPSLLGLWTKDNKSDHFFTIKTDRWAFDNEKELLEMLNDFKRRV